MCLVLRLPLSQVLWNPFADSSIKPLMEGITQHLLPVVFVFQQKLFGSSFCVFKSVTTESTTLVTEPVVLEARTSNGDTLNVLVIESDATTADVSPNVALTTSPINRMFLILLLLNYVYIFVDKVVGCCSDPFF